MPEEIFEVRDRRNGSWFWCQNEMLKTKIPHTIKLVYFALCSYANKNTETCYPSMNKIAEVAGISKRSVVRAMRVLEKARAIRIKKEKGKVSEYSLLKLTGATMALVSKETQNRCQKRHKTGVIAGYQNKRDITNEKNNGGKGLEKIRGVVDNLGLRRTYA